MQNQFAANDMGYGQAPYPQGFPYQQGYAPYPPQPYSPPVQQEQPFQRTQGSTLMAAQQASKGAIEKQTNLLVDKTSIERMKKQFAMALPSFYTVDRFVRACYNVLNAKNPKEAKTVQLIRQSTPESFFGCLLACAALGLEPNGPLGHAYIIPFQNWRDRRVISVTCQLIVGYKGLIDLARRSGNVQTIIAHEVRQNDYFKFNFGTGELPIHTFDLQADRGEIIAVYAVARFADNSYHFDLMTKSDIERIRQGSKSKDSDPWRDHYDEMAKKTIIRRIAKYLPMDVQKAAAYDGAALKYDPTTDSETGLLFDGYIDVDASEQPTEDSSPAPEPESAANVPAHSQTAPSMIPVPPMSNPTPNTGLSSKALDAAASIKSSVAKRTTRKTAAPKSPPVSQVIETQAEPVQNQNEQNNMEPQTMPPVAPVANTPPTKQYLIPASEFGTQAGLCETREQFDGLVKLLDQKIQEGKFDPDKRGSAFEMIYDTALQQGIELVVPPDLQIQPSTDDDIPW